MIENHIGQKERLEKLNTIAQRQIEVLMRDNNVVGISELENSTKLIKEILCD